jgi:hypothetical protein
MSLRVSRWLATVVGIVTPSLETIRRWHELRTLTVSWPAYLDDVLLGGFLLYGAWSSGRNPAAGRPVLAAAWGFMLGLAYSSLFYQWANLSEPDPSGVSPPLVVSIKAAGLVIGMVGLLAVLAPAPRMHAGASSTPNSQIDP